MKKIVRRILLLLLVSLLSVGLLANTMVFASADGKKDNPGLASDPVSVQLLAITDFHGYLKPVPETDKSNGQIKVKGVTQVVGGAAYNAAHINKLREGHENSLLFSVGDAFSGWPGEADYFFNEATVEFLNTIGVDAAVPGNHELDISEDFLVKHMIKGKPFGTPGVDSSFNDSTGRQFHGSDSEWVDANIVDKKNNKPIMKPYTIKQIPDGHGGTIPIGIIGLTQMDTVTGTMSFQPDLTQEPLVETADRCAKELQDQGVETIVVLLHEGGVTKGNSTDINDLTSPSGPAFDFAKQVSPAIDAIFTGHWHCVFNGMVNDPAGNPRPVIEGSNHGRVISEINLVIDPTTKDVIRDRTTSQNYAVTRDIQPDPDVEKMVNYWVDRTSERAAQPITAVNGDLTRTRNAYGESTLSDVFADAYYDAGRKTVDEETGEKIYFGGAGMSKKPADFAMVKTTPKIDFLYAKSTNTGDSDGLVTFGEFAKANNGMHSPVVVVSYTGQQIKDILEQQWRLKADGTESINPLDVSYNVSYKVDLSKSIGDRLQPSDFIINGKPLVLDRTYRVAISSFMASNGAGFTGLTSFTDPVRIASWVVYDYLRSHSLIQVPELNRVTPIAK